MNIHEMLDDLYFKINSICPIYGISCGKMDDKSTWRIDYKDQPNDKQLDQISSIIENYAYKPKRKFNLEKAINRLCKETKIKTDDLFDEDSNV